MMHVTLYGKPGCHLCEEAREVVDQVRATRPFELEEVDITRDPALEARYRERIPVIAIDGREALELVIEMRELERCLASMTP
ncbi:MAG TPA: glutaredoxin family protein [Thermoleophilaceae bacterium]|jgi:glutaredoxin|nr:glutaredoxin family protein [Thermoleophilaceae bacterium]